MNRLPRSHVRRFKEWVTGRKTDMLRVDGRVYVLFFPPPFPRPFPNNNFFLVVGFCRRPLHYLCPLIEVLLLYYYLCAILSLLLVCKILPGCFRRGLTFVRFFLGGFSGLLQDLSRVRPTVIYGLSPTLRSDFPPANRFFCPTLLSVLLLHITSFPIAHMKH